MGSELWGGLDQGLYQVPRPEAELNEATSETVPLAADDERSQTIDEAEHYEHD
jgi:hypothetical protein